MAARIMVVDDDDGTRTVLTRLLELEGHVVDAYENGETALTQLKIAQYDVLITDLVMPGMSGLDLVRAARSTNGKLRYLIATGHPADPDAPADIGWLSKPIDVDELLATLGPAFT